MYIFFRKPKYNIVHVIITRKSTGSSEYLTDRPTETSRFHDGPGQAQKSSNE